MNGYRAVLRTFSASALALLATMVACESGNGHSPEQGADGGATDSLSGAAAGLPSDAGSDPGSQGGIAGEASATAAGEGGLAGNVAEVPTAGAGAAAGGAGGGEGPGSPSGLRLLILGKGQTPVFDDTKFAPMLEGLTGIAPTRIHTTAPAPLLTAADLEGQDVVIVEDLSRAYSADEASALASWVEAGNGLILLAGFDADLVPITSLASTYGVGYEPTLLQPSVPAYLDAFAFPPITAGVSSLKVFGAFALTTTDTTAVVFATLPPKTLGLALSHGAGRVAVWGDDWVVADQELERVDTNQAKPTVQFWSNVLTWASHR